MVTVDDRSLSIGDYPIVNLDGDWQLVGWDPISESEHRLTGQVPGHVHADLAREGIIPDPFWRDQAEACQWVERWFWRYERQFELPEGIDLEWVVLEFGGLDTHASIRLNGQSIGRTANMFIAHRFEVGPWLRPGINRLEVAFLPNHIALVGKDASRFFSCFSSDRVYARRMQCAYGWDWAHRFVGAGIWRPARLHFHHSVRLADCCLRTLALTGGAAELEIEYEIERRGGKPLALDLTIDDPDGATVWRQTVEPAGHGDCIRLRLENPRLWFPNGYGAQPLYRLTASLRRSTANEPGEGEVLDHHSFNFGIRMIEIEELPDVDGGGSSFTLVVNGARIFARGGNWVPASPFPGTLTAAQYERLIDMARRGNMNLLRAWGGGIYEPDAFWDACDRLGILVSQDFLLACAQYPEADEDFLALLRVEFEQAIRRLRNRASLAFWSGNNELGQNSDPATEFWGKKISLEISGPLCRRLDPTRPYRATSPYGGNPNNSPLAGDCHRSAWYNPDFFRSDLTDYRGRIARLTGRFLSESAVPGAPPRRALLKFMTPADLADPAGAMWEYHTKDNPYNGINDATHYRLLEKTAAAIFGPPADNDRRIAHMEMAQHEFVRLTTESLRRKKFDCSGVQYWMYNDNWPASGWSLVDWWGFPKAAWHAARRAFAPVIVMIEDTAMTPADGDPTAATLRVWVCNDRLVPIAGRLRLGIQPWTGAPRWEEEVSVAVEANAAQVVYELPRAIIGDKLGRPGAPDAVLVADLEACAVAGAEKTGAIDRDRAWFFDGLPCAMTPPPARLRVEGPTEGQSGTLSITTDVYARVVTLEADLDFSDNYFDLLPGETRTIEWSSPGEAHPGPIPVTCWNAVIV